MIDVLTTMPNRRAKSAVCLTVRGSDGSEQLSFVLEKYDDSSEKGI